MPPNIKDKNGTVTVDQAAVFKDITGYALPSSVTTRQGASYAIVDATSSKIKKPMTSLRLRALCASNIWSTKVVGGLSVPSLGGTGHPLPQLGTLATGQAVAKADAVEAATEPQPGVLLPPIEVVHVLSDKDSAKQLRAKLLELQAAFTLKADRILLEAENLKVDVARIAHVMQEIGGPPDFDKQPPRPGLTDAHENTSLDEPILLKRPPVL